MSAHYRANCLMPAFTFVLVFMASPLFLDLVVRLVFPWRFLFGDVTR